MQKLLWFLMGCFVGGIFALIALRQEFSRGQTPSTLPRIPVCDSLLEQGPDNVVAILVSPVASHPGIVCARVYNDTAKVGHYGLGDLRLERHWVRLVWLPHLRLKDFLLVGRGISKFDGAFSLSPGGYRDFYCPPPYDDSAPPGKYRVRLRYRVPPEEEEHAVYSEAFVLP